MLPQQLQLQLLMQVITMEAFQMDTNSSILHWEIKIYQIISHSSTRIITSLAQYLQPQYQKQYLNHNHTKLHH
jgi:hypothetical protein